MISLRVPIGPSSRLSRYSSVKRSSAAMSALLGYLDRVLGTVGLRQTCLALFARRHGAVAEQPAVTLVILAEQVRDEVVAAAVPLAALGADLHFHRVVPCLRRVPCQGRSGPATLPSSWAPTLPHA